MKHKDLIRQTTQGGSWAGRLVREPLVPILNYSLPDNWSLGTSENGYHLRLG